MPGRHFWVYYRALRYAMSDETMDAAGRPLFRCPTCDSVVGADARRCLMCGTVLPERPLSPPASPTPETPQPAAAVETLAAEAAPIPELFPAVLRERQSPVVVGITAVFAIIILILGTLVWQYRDPNLTLALAPTFTPIPPTLTFTPTITPLPTETQPPTLTPSVTPMPAPSETPQPPRLHTVSSGDTLFGLALRYRVSAEAIAEVNGFSPQDSILLGRTLEIPWPTPTPPLVPVGVEVNGDLVIADPTDCSRYQVVSGDSLSAIAARFDVDYALFLLVNRLSNESIIQPGDTVCIPQIVYNATLPPTPGPSPTPSLTPPPPGPSLLYPARETVIEPPDGPITLQWVAVKDLAPDEWYMVELTDLDRPDSAPYRGFTRDTAFRVPQSWRPPVDAAHRLRWRVSIVQVRDWRADGLPIYTFGGQSSRDAFFIWPGAVPTPTPTATPTPTQTPIPG
jgi:LysM repeat protein